MVRSIKRARTVGLTPPRIVFFGRTGGGGSNAIEGVQVGASVSFSEGPRVTVSNCVKLCKKPDHFGPQLIQANRVAPGAKQAVHGAHVKNNCTARDALQQEGDFSGQGPGTGDQVSQGTGVGFPREAATGGDVADG